MYIQLKILLVHPINVELFLVLCQFVNFSNIAITMLFFSPLLPSKLTIFPLCCTLISSRNLKKIFYALKGDSKTKEISFCYRLSERERYCDS